MRCAVARARTSGWSTGEQTMSGRFVVMHRGDLLHCVAGPVHDEVAEASNAVGDVGNVVGIVLDFPINVACPARIGPAQP